MELNELIPYPKSEDYRSDNARKVNASKKPNGYLYIIQIKEHDLYKIGVSANVKRRIKDIRSHIPFYCKVIYLNRFNNVYDLEKQIHDSFVINKVKGEWFQCYEHDIKNLITSLHPKNMTEVETLIQN